MLKRFGIAFYLISAASSAIGFSLLMLFFELLRYGKLKGAASGSLPQSASYQLVFLCHKFDVYTYSLRFWKGGKILFLV
jgi:hypothetical protein